MLLLMAVLIYFELRAKDNLPEIWAAFRQQLSGSNVIWLLLALLLMPFNWLAETQKWRPFLIRYEPMSRWKALQAVCAGVAVSLFTPNRVGEYGGRIFFVRPENQWKAVLVNLIGNFAQFMVLLSLGTAGTVWLIGRYGNLSPGFVEAIAMVALIGLGLMLLVYLNIQLVIPIARKIPVLHYIKRFVKDLRLLEQFTRVELLYILRWASIRYGIYATQYFYLLKFFGIKISLIEAYSGISAIFLFQTTVPLPPVIGLVARGNMAIQVWSQMGANEISSLAATFSLWIINLIFPALVGTFSLLYVNIAKTFVYENEQP